MAPRNQHTINVIRSRLYNMYYKQTLVVATTSMGKLRDIDFLYLWLRDLIINETT